MSDHPVKKSVKEYFDYQGFGGKLLFTVALAVTSLALAAWGGFLSTKQFAFSWLFAFSFFFTILTGSLFWILVHHAVDADWSVVVRRQLENVAWLFPVLAILFIPIIFMSLPLKSKHKLNCSNFLNRHQKLHLLNKFYPNR